MSAIRGKLLFSALAIVLVLGLAFFIFFAQRSGVSARSADRRLRLYSVSYVPTANVKYELPTHGEGLKYQCQRVLDKLGVKSLPWTRVYAVLGSDVYPGPGLIVHGRIEFGDLAEFELVSDSGKVFRHALRFPSYSSDPTERFLFWRERLPNDRYHVRLVGETNDLAVFELR